MKPSKLGSSQNQPQEQVDITDIAEIFQKLNNRSSINFPKPYSEYDAQSIFPPPSQISVYNENQSDRSKSNCIVNLWKRSGVSENKEEKQMGFVLSKPQLGSKKLKRIQIQKLHPNQKLIINQKSNIEKLPFTHLIRQEQVSNKDSVINNNNNKDLVPLHPPPANFRITDFFTNKKLQSQKVKRQMFTKKEQKCKSIESFLRLRVQQKEKNQQFSSFNNIQEPKINPLIYSLVQKNNKKRKTIEDLRQELRLYKQKKQQSSLKLLHLKNQEKLKLKSKLLQTYQIKMQYEKFQSQISQVLLQKNIEKKLMPDIELRLKNLQENKKKGSHKRGTNRKQTHTDEQSVGNNENRQSQNPLHIPQKRHYINHWISKLQKMKEKLELDKNYYIKLGNLNKKVQKVSHQIQERFLENQVLKDYVLFSINYPLAQTKAKVDQLSEINTFNLQNLRYEILSLLKLPKFSTQINKSIIRKQLSNLYKLSKKLHNSTSCYFLQTTIAQTTKNTQFVVYGRQKIDQYENLLSAMHKYQGFSQLMVKYITRICLIVLEQIKIKVDIPVFLLPTNIFFSPKCDIKFSNILMNNLFLKEEFKPYLNSQKLYYFVPPEGLSQKDFSNAGIWSLGILLYFIIYEKYPFEYEIDNLFQKETFWIYNELNFPSKPVVSQKFKDFITTCLSYKEKDTSSLVKHQFLAK